MHSFQLTLGSRELQRAQIDSCINYINRHPKYAYATIVLIVENAPGSRGAEIYSLVRDYTHCVVMNEYGRQRQHGVPKDAPITKSMGIKTRMLLECHGIGFAEDMGTYPCANAVEYKNNIKKLQLQLVSELQAFWIDALGRWSGKTGGKNDDVAISLMIPYYWALVFLESTHYAADRQKFPGSRIVPRPVHQRSAPRVVDAPR
jgi:hypothetical protein